MPAETVCSDRSSGGGQLGWGPRQAGNLEPASAECDKLGNLAARNGAGVTDWSRHSATLHH